ncbi:MAG: hypothetical protein ABIA75_04320 [Candidatus Neomarinimicrobiota bacterium]
MKKLLIPVVAIFMLLLVGCEDSDTNTATTEQQLLALLDGDDIFGLDGLDDGEAIEGDYESGLELPGTYKTLGDTIDPDSGLRIRFGRRITSVAREVEFRDTDADTAYATITRVVNGNFVIFTRDTASGDTSRWIKPFTTDFIRQVRFVRVADSDTLDWKIDALTVGVGITGTKVNIARVDWFTADGTTVLFSYGGDVINQFFSRDEIAAFTAWETLRVEVTVTNQGPEFPFNSGEGVLLHYGSGPGVKGRKAINDSGRSGDAVASDNIFTGYWRVHGPGWDNRQGRWYQHRAFRSFVDVIDFGSLYAEDEAIHSVFWALPYRSMRPDA